jgi:hypothetical protein
MKLALKQLKSGNSLDILIINSTLETNNFITPITNLLIKQGISYTVCQYNNIPDTLISDGIIISASPMGNDIIGKQLKDYKQVLMKT